ncbi:hypothetical protein DC31_05895 [Microbacterium sp. CH12i]|uniref:hypothetical protein n=1 Tax=Microbacterium sp. CH12i TaxID=1479651 RepID=UPI000460AFE3|nr:hypothetical protein [Microbacterium sp. CH12i]KDA04623.1 hypothetical protein DC31_05895 [Microbacterium sp. CH12i]
MNTTTARVIYIRRRLLAGHKIAYWYQIRHPEDDPTKILIAGPSAPRVVGAWQDSEALTNWRIQDRADAQIAANAQRAQNDLQGIPDSFEEAPETLSAHFSRLNHSQRAALIPLVQARILDPR